MSRRAGRALAAGLVVSLLSIVAPGVGVAGVPNPVAGLAAGYLISQQQPNGGFDTAADGIETTQTILALAASSQQSAAWNGHAARSDLELVRAFRRNPLDRIDQIVSHPVQGDTAGTAATAAQVIALVANPLGLSASEFDPADPTTGPVDLLTQLDAARRGDGSYELGDFHAVLYAAIGLSRARPPVPGPLFRQILVAQNDDGSWSASGAPQIRGDDVETTALALIALKSAGRGLNDVAVARAVSYLARRQQRTGAWQAGGIDDPEATSAAAAALSALHVDVTVGSWTTPFATTGARAGYRSPYDWLALRQEPTTGRILSPRDVVGVTTLPTSATVQALARQWYLEREHAAFAAKVSFTLGSPDASRSTEAADEVDGALGPNVSVSSARQGAAAALLGSLTGRQAAASDLFSQALGRPIDPSGLSYWSRALIRISRPEMLTRLTGSAEFYRNAGGNAPAFVDAAYRAVLGREPDPGGRLHWLSRLAAGVPVERIAGSLVASVEYRRAQVDAAYAELLGRKPDPVGSDYWVKKLATTRIEVLLAGIAGSRELLDGL